MNVFDGAYRGTRVLVTGHTGFKGAWLCQWLLNQGAIVAGYSVDVPTTPALFEVLGLEKHLTHVQGDVRDAAAIKQCFDDFKPEMVFHLAAQALVRPSYDDPVGTFDVNVIGTLRVLECMRACRSVRAGVMVTTDKCYENREWEYGYREVDRLGGKDPYSASKGAAELAISSYFRSFLNQADAPWVASVRAGNVIGGGDWAVDRIVPDAVRAWAANAPLVIRSPHATRPWQHVLEPLSGYLCLGARLLARGEQVNGEAFNFGPQRESNRTVADLLSQLTQSWPDGVVRVDASMTANKKEAGLLMLNTERAAARLGWSAVLTFTETATMTMEWYRQFYRGDPGSVAELTIRQIRAYSERAAALGRRWATS